MTLASATERMREYAMCHYGNLFSTEDPVFDQKEKLWKAQLKSNYPRLIKNDQPEERFIRVLPLKGLGTICLDEALQFVEGCSSKREESISLIHSYLEVWREQVENIIVTASSQQLAKTHPARTFLHPANMILSNFRQKKDGIITNEDMEKLQRRHVRIERWVSLLKDLNLIKKTEDGYTYGDMFTKLETKIHTHSEFENLSMAYILEKSYPLLKEIFHIQQFEPLVHLDSCYYRPALEAEDVLYQTSDSLFRRFVADYNYRPNIELRHVLLDLQKSDALRYENSYYYANDEIFEEMLNLKSQAPSIALPHA
jgi:GTPase SAR1 family protein